MHKTNGDRLKWLKNRVRKLEKEILQGGLENELISYLEEASKKKCELVSDAEWEVLLPIERSALLIPYYHNLRAELVEMKRRAEEPTTMERVNEWLETPWIKVVIAVGSLAEVATLLLHAILSGGSFLSAPDHDSTDLATWRMRDKQ